MAFEKIVRPYSLNESDTKKWGEKRRANQSQRRPTEVGRNLQIPRCKYLSERRQDIKIRTATAFRSMADLSKTWKGHGVSITTKMRLNRALIQPIAIYGCESWTLTASVEKKLLTYEMAALRSILGVRKLDKIRNKEIRRRLGCTNTLVQLVCVRQHKWLRHVLRMQR